MSLTSLTATRKSTFSSECKVAANDRSSALFKSFMRRQSGVSELIVIVIRVDRNTLFTPVFQREEYGIEVSM